MITDEQIATRIRNAVDELNACLKIAAQSAIKCEIDIDQPSVQCVGAARVAQKRIAVEISKAL